MLTCECRSKVKPSSTNLRNMEPTNWLLPVQPDHHERRTNTDPCAWLLKVVIVRIELQLKDPTFSLRSLPSDSFEFLLWQLFRRDMTVSNNSIGDRLALACEKAVIDASAIYQVMLRVEKNDNLREVLTRALRSIREAFLQAGSSYRIADSGVLGVFNIFLRGMASSAPRSKQEHVDASESDSELAIAYTFHAFLTSVLHLLTFVFQYLIGYVDRGGSKTYSSGAFDFRANFVSLLLFQAAYVWIKFRHAARSDCRKRKAPVVQHEVVDIETGNLKGVYARPIKDKSSGVITRFKYEPRFTPPRQEGDDGTGLCSKRLPVGEYHTRAEAEIVLQVARYLYDKDGGCVELEDGRYKFFIPPMSEQERGLVGKEKRKWVTCTAKQVGKQMYADFQREKGKHLAMATEAGSPGAKFSDPSSSALPLACPQLPMLTTMAAEPAIASAAPSSPSIPLLPFDGAIEGDADDSFEALSGFEDMLAEFGYDPGLPNLADHQLSVASFQMQYQEFAQLPGDPSLPELRAVSGGIEHDSERELNPSPSFQQGRVLADVGTENIAGKVFLPQSVSDLQQLLPCHQKCLEDNARQFVDLDHQLNAYQIQISNLQQEKEQLRAEKEQLRAEIESLKSSLEQVAKSQIATWTGIMMDIERSD